MSRISGTADRPIATKERLSETEQTSETSSIQKTDIEAKTRLNAEQPANEQAPPADTKGQVSEHRLDGKARQAELQSKLPIPSTPPRNEFPDKRSDLDPNVHLDEKIDVTKNLPDGRSINTGLKGLDWGSSKEKTGPNHMGVELTYGGMKAPTNRIDEVLNAGKPNQPNTSAPQKDGRREADEQSRQKAGMEASKEGNAGYSEGKGWTPPPGVELSSRAPKGDLVSGLPDPAYEAGKVVAQGIRDAIKVTTVVASAPGDMYDSFMKGLTEPKETPPPPTPEPWQDGGKKTMTDPDAVGGGVPTSDEIAKKMKGRLGQVEHGINPDLGVGGGPTGELKKPIDLLSDPTDDGNSSFETSTPEKAKLLADIHGPRTVNPDSGFGPVQPDGGIKGGGGDPGGGDPSDHRP